MKIAIVGSRSFNRLDLVDALVDALPANTVVVSGGANGVDDRAVRRARRRGLEVEEIHAAWRSFERAFAGLARNTRIVTASDRVVAFWDGKSAGTKDTIDKARAAKKIAIVVDPDVEVVDGAAWGRALARLVLVDRAAIEALGKKNPR